MKLVAAAIIERSGCVLLARRTLRSKLAGLWEFPGGKLEEGETPTECLIRELQEELGITAEIGEYFCTSDFRYNHGNFRVLFYRATWVGGDFEKKVHDQIKWVKIIDLINYDLLPADIPIARKLVEQDRSN